MKEKRQEKRQFISSRGMREAKYDESIAFSVAKREGYKIVGVRQYLCGCGNDGCFITIKKEPVKIKVSKKKLKKKRYSEKICPHFGGKVLI